MTDDLNDINTSENIDSSDGYDVEQTRPQPYAKEPLYRELLTYYQNADWDKSLETVEKLLADYPGDPGLLQFQHEIEMRNSLQRLGQESEKVERREKLRKVGLNVIIVVGIVAIIGFAGLWGYNQYQSNVEQAQMERTQVAIAATLQSKYENALNFLQAGKADQALALFEEISAVDPDYEDVTEKIQEAEAYMATDARYMDARTEYQQGNLESAKGILEEILATEGNFKDSEILLQNINDALDIRALKAVARAAYQQEDWRKVVDTHDEIQTIDATADLEDLEQELFMSYMYLVLETADKPDVTNEEVEEATEYYQKARAIFPQNRELAEERAELQRQVSSLLTNKLFINAKELVESENYSIQSMEEALSMLNKAKNFGSASPAVTAEISLLQNYLSALNDFNDRRWNDAIRELEELNRNNPDYANGMVQYLLYESYMGQGDALLSFAEYSDAREVFELAETFAFGDVGNNLRLFQIEIRIGYVLRRLSLMEESAEYFRYAAGLVNFSNKLTSEYPETTQAFRDAESAMNQRDFWNAARLYEIAFENLEMIYQFETMNVNRGDTLAQIAFESGSSLAAIFSMNDGLGTNLVVRSDQEIMIPVLIEDRN